VVQLAHLDDAKAASGSGHWVPASFEALAENR
jgi:hypothetical protein